MRDPTPFRAVLLSLILPGAAGFEPAWRLEGGLTLRRFEQQVKSEVGGRRGDRLVEETEVGLALVGSARVFTGFDESGAAVVAPAVGGGYAEAWLGPVARAEWRRLFLPAIDGDRDGAFRTLPSVAWLLAAGGAIPLGGKLELSLRLEPEPHPVRRAGGPPLRRSPPRCPPPEQVLPTPSALRAGVVSTWRPRRR
jgi:hypothetical protein